MELNLSARVLSTLITIPRMTSIERRTALVESLPENVKDLGIALANEDPSNLVSEDERRIYDIIIAQAQ